MSCRDRTGPVPLQRDALQCCPPAAGFTLIELAVVVAIIGMVLLVVLPRLPSTDSENLKVSARTLASTVRYLQDRSATGRTGYVIHAEPGSEVLQIRETGSGGDRDPSDPLLRRRVLQPGIQVADMFIPRRGVIRDGQVRVTITPGGLRELTVFHLRSADDTFWTVMCFPAGGKVKVYEGYQEGVP